MIRTYSELSNLQTFKERFDYLNLNGKVGEDTFGHSRFLNQDFYSSPEWRRTRRNIIIRDNGCDMGLEGYSIQGRIYVHHINPITVDDILERRPCLFDPENLICVSSMTHEAITYGIEDMLPTDPVIRRPNDTCPWR